MPSAAYILGFDSFGTDMLNPYCPELCREHHAEFNLGRANASTNTQPLKYLIGRNPVSSPGAVLFHIMAKHRLNYAAHTLWEGMCQNAQDSWENAAQELKKSLPQLKP